MASLILSGANTFLLLSYQRAAQEANDANRAEIDGVRTDLTNLRQNLTTLQGQLNAQGTKITDLGSSLSSISGKLASVNGTLNAGLKSLNATLESQENQTPAEVYKENYKSVVVIKSDVGQGSGFVYDDKNHILTNWHVVNGTSKLEVEFYDRSIATAEVVGSDPYSDVAVIMVSQMPADAAPLKRARDRRHHTHQEGRRHLPQGRFLVHQDPEGLEEIRLEEADASPDHQIRDSGAQPLHR